MLLQTGYTLHKRYCFFIEIQYYSWCRQNNNEEINHVVQYIMPAVFPLTDDD